MASNNPRSFNRFDLSINIPRNESSFPEERQIQMRSLNRIINRRAEQLRAQREVQVAIDMMNEQDDLEWSMEELRRAMEARGMRTTFIATAPASTHMPFGVTLGERLRLEEQDKDTLGGRIRLEEQDDSPD